MKKTVWAILIAAMLAGCSTFQRVKSNRNLAKARVQNTSFLAEIPFEYVASLPVFEVEIEGRKYRFIFDTGGYTVLSEALIARLKGVRKGSYIDVKDGNSTVGRVETFVLDQLEIGGLVFKDVGFAKIGFTESEWFRCLGLDGTIGPNVMKEAVWQFDLQTRRIECADRRDKLATGSDAYHVDVHTNNVYKPYVDIQMGNTLHRVGFDTGFNGFLQLKLLPGPSHLDSFPSVEKRGGRTNAGNGTTYADTRIIYAESVLLGGCIIRDVVASMGTQYSSDLLGSQILDRYRLLIDLKGGVMLLHVLEEPHIAPECTESFGFGLDYRVGKVVIDYVYEPGPASNMGLTPGQEVVKINGIPPMFNNYCHFAEHFRLPEGDTILLELQGEDGPYAVRLTREALHLQRSEDNR